MVEPTQADLDHANLVWGQGNWIGCDDCGGVHHKNYHPRGRPPEKPTPTVAELLEWIADAEHHPGCSGGFPNMRCKCGRREFDLPWGQDPETNGMDNA